MKRSLAPIILLTTLACASQARDDQGDAAAAFEPIMKEFAASLGAGDAGRWLALWEDNGIQLPPDAPAVEGKQRIAAKIRSLLDQFKFDMTINNAEAHASGDWGFVRGTYQAKLTPKKSGNVIAIDGKYLTVLAKQADGSWKIHRDIFNSNVPPGK
jgi:ketosteroid isomerase-like protein